MLTMLNVMMVKREIRAYLGDLICLHPSWICNENLHT